MTFRRRPSKLRFCDKKVVQEPFSGGSTIWPQNGVPLESQTRPTGFPRLQSGRQNDTQNEPNMYPEREPKMGAQIRQCFLFIQNGIKMVTQN